ncbi:amidase [Nocardioides halotolerans]|uniref:amidase n=1 Tax=Nocardioides halotolerans TaxID=433660 RepID=UPI0012FA0867|nr:amidase [Nocardioides halotolerans]
MSDLDLDLTATEMADLVRRKDASPAELLERTVARMKAHDPVVCAWSEVDLDHARAVARSLTDEAAHGRFRGPVHGVPFAAKDQFHVRGMVTRMRGADSAPADVDATAVARLRASGAVLVGKTTMPLGGRPPPTRNPWHPDHTPGGTSSGSGAAVAARMVPVALAEQTAGSALRPAAYCGVAAIKPTYGRISRAGLEPMTWSRDHVGIIGLSVADLALVLGVIAGPDPDDPTSLPDPPARYLDAMHQPRPARIGLIGTRQLPAEAEPAMLDCTASAAERLAAAGGEVRPVWLPDELAAAGSIVNLLRAEGAALQERRRGDGAPGSYWAGELVPAPFYVQARRARVWISELVEEAMAGLDVLLMPAAPGAAPRGLERTGSAQYLSPWSFLGLPTATVSGGLAPEGLPLGLQLIARRRDDAGLLRAAAWVESVLGRLGPPPMS